jgi:hypothetical protein
VTSAAVREILAERCSEVAFPRLKASMQCRRSRLWAVMRLDASRSGRSGGGKCWSVTAIQAGAFGAYHRASDRR